MPRARKTPVAVSIEDADSDSMDQAVEALLGPPTPPPPSREQAKSVLDQSIVEEKRSDLIFMATNGETDKVSKPAAFLSKASAAVITKLYDEAIAVETKQITTFVTSSVVGVAGTFLEGSGYVESGERMTNEILANPVVKKSLRKCTYMIPDLYGMEGVIVAAAIVGRHVATKKVFGRINTQAEESADMEEEEGPDGDTPPPLEPFREEPVEKPMSPDRAHYQ